MSILLQGWDPSGETPFDPLLGGYARAPGRPPQPILSWGWWWAGATEWPVPLTLSWGWWWAQPADWFPWPAVVAPAPALWWSWWWAQPLGRPAPRYASGRGLAHGRYRYRSAGSGGDDVAASALPPTPQLVLLRSRDKFVPFSLDFARDVLPGDGVSAYWITVLAQPLEQEGVVPTDVTADLLMGQSSTGTQVTAVLCNANAVPGTQYTVRVVATMASGVTLEQTIGDGTESRILCDR